MRRGATYIAIAGGVIALAAAVSLVGGPAPSAPRPAPSAIVAPSAPGLRPATPPATVTASPKSAASDAHPADTGCVIVKLKRDVTASKLSRLGLGNATQLRQSGLVLCPAPAGVTADEFAKRLEASGAVDYAGADHLFEPAYSSKPNDPAFSDPTTWTFTDGDGSTSTIEHAKSWGLRGAGSSHFDEVWPALEHQKAGPQEVRVAVIDTGFYFAGHRDLITSNITAAIDECATYNPSANAGSHLTTDTDVTPVSNAPTSAPHGTMVASQIGQGTSNGVELPGAAWDTRVDVYKVQGIATSSFGDVRVGDAVIPESAIVNAITDAVADADSGRYRLVINLSLVLEQKSPPMSPLRVAVADAISRGAVVVAAAGNEGRPQLAEPASYPNVIAVGAARIDRGTLTRASFSNYATELDLLAPGENVWGPTKPGLFDPRDPHPVAGYAWWSGTSMAAPYVSAAATLLLRAEPTLTPAEVESYLTRTALDVEPSGRDQEHGWGMLDVFAAYRLLATPVTTSDTRPNYAESATIHFSVADRDSEFDTRTYFELDDWGVTQGATLSTKDYFDQPGLHTVRYWSVDGNGVAESEKTVSFRLGSDNAAPITSSNAVSSYMGRAVIALSAIDPRAEDWGVGSTHYRLDAGPDATGTAVTVGTPGVHSLAYWSIDLAGNVEDRTVATFSIKPLTARATIARNVHTVSHKHHIHLAGRLSPFLADDKVTVQIKYPGAHHYTKFYGRSVYSSGSWATLTYTPTRHGTYWFRVVYAGDNSRLSRLAYTSRGVHVHVR